MYPGVLTLPGSLSLAHARSLTLTLSLTLSVVLTLSVLLSHARSRPLTRTHLLPRSLPHFTDLLAVAASSPSVTVLSRRVSQTRVAGCTMLTGRLCCHRERLVVTVMRGLKLWRGGVTV